MPANPSTAASSQEAYQAYLGGARARFMEGTRATVKQIDSIYARAYKDVTAEMAKLLPSQPSAHHLSVIQGALAEARANLSNQVLDATMHGIGLSVGAATGGAEAIALKVLGNAFEAGGISAMYQAVNQRAVLAFATRTRFDGLRLSDRVWLAADKWRGYVTRAVESAVAAGTPARKLAEALDPYLKTGTARPSSLAVRRRLGIPKNISYQSLRVARTEIATAFKEGTVLGHSRTPSYLGVQWQISAGHPFEDICDELVGGGPQNDGIYPAGSEPLQPHPNCMCVVSPVHEPPEQFRQRLQEWIDNPASDPDLEAWHKDVARPFFDGKPITVKSVPTKVKVLTGTGSVKPGLHKAPSLPTPSPQTAAQAQQVSPSTLEGTGGGSGGGGGGAAPTKAKTGTQQVQDDLKEAVSKASSEKAAAKAAQKVEDQVEAILDEATAKLQKLENDLKALEDAARAKGTPILPRTSAEAAETHLDDMVRAGKMTKADAATVRPSVEVRMRDAGVDRLSTEVRIKFQRALNDEWKTLSRRAEKVAGKGKVPNVVLTEKPIMGNGGRASGEVYGNTVVLNATEIITTPKAIADQISYHMGRAIYRNTLTAAEQQTWQSTFSTLKGQIAHYANKGADRAEGFFGEIFAAARRGDAGYYYKNASDDLLQQIANVEAKMGLSANSQTTARYVLKARQAKALKAQQKAAADAVKSAAPKQPTGTWPLADDAMRHGTRLADDPKWWKRLTKEEQAAVNRYTGSGYSDMNREMLDIARGIRTTPSPGVRALQRALKKQTAPTSKRIIWRGLQSDSRVAQSNAATPLGRVQDVYKPGEPVHFPAFSSSAPRTKDAWNGPVMFEMHTKRGQYIGQFSRHPSEGEFLIEADTHWTVRKVIQVRVEGSMGPTKRVIVQLDEA